jgi:hypothetical protein
MRLGKFVHELRAAEAALADGFRRVADRHQVDHDVWYLGHRLAKECDALAERLAPFPDRHGFQTEPEGDNFVESLVDGLRAGLRRGMSHALGRAPVSGVLLLRDLQGLSVLAHDCHGQWIVVGQGAMSVRDKALNAVVSDGRQVTEKHLRWLQTKLKEVAPQVLSQG